MGEPARHLGGYVPGGDARTWAPEVWRELVRLYQPRRMVDVGAGEGHTAKLFSDHGIQATAIEGDPAAAGACVERLGGDRVILHDFERGPLAIALRWDLAWSSEFVEHVEEAYLPNVVSMLASCRVIALTHALPGQPGVHHVNCRPPEYWMGVFAAIGYRCNLELSERLRGLTQAEFVRRTLLVFERRDG